MASSCRIAEKSFAFGITDGGLAGFAVYVRCKQLLISCSPTAAGENRRFSPRFRHRSRKLRLSCEGKIPTFELAAASVCTTPK